MLIDALTSKLPTEDKLLWVILIVFTSIIGAIIYFVVVRNNPNYAGIKPAARKAAKRAAQKHLYRSSRNKVIAGVCSGLAEYFDVDPVMVRLIWVILTLLGGSGILLYIIFWIIVPKR